MSKNAKIEYKLLRDASCPADLYKYVEDLSIANERKVSQQLRVIIREHKAWMEKHK